MSLQQIVQTLPNLKLPISALEFWNILLGGLLQRCTILLRVAAFLVCDHAHDTMQLIIAKTDTKYGVSAYLCTDLVAALAGLQMHDFAHDAAERSNCSRRQKTLKQPAQGDSPGMILFSLPALSSFR